MRLPIELRHVWEAYHHVRMNKGGHGVDQQDWTKFDARLYHHLYKLWNRLSSGSYFPQAVRRVYIPKTGGGERPLGIPTVISLLPDVKKLIRVKVYVNKSFRCFNEWSAVINY